MPPSPLHFARSADFWGEGGVSGACPAESSRAGHPEGRKRRSGWGVGTDVKGWTRESAFEEYGSGLWVALVGGAVLGEAGCHRFHQCGSKINQLTVLGWWVLTLREQKTKTRTGKIIMNNHTSPLPAASRITTWPSGGA